MSSICSETSKSRKIPCKVCDTVSRMRASAMTAAWRVSAPSSREMTAATSRVLTTSASKDATTCGNLAQALAKS